MKSSTNKYLTAILISICVLTFFALKPYISPPENSVETESAHIVKNISVPETESTLVCTTPPASTEVPANNIAVYRTKSGECYHSQGCAYLKSCIEITLSEAKERGLRPCSRCNPPK